MLELFSENVIAIAMGGVFTFASGWLITLTQSWHGRWTHDGTSGIQKFHDKPTPRIGGLAILLGCLVILSLLNESDLTDILVPLLIGGLVPFFFGFREDVTKQVSVSTRLMATMTGAIVVISLTGWHLNHLDIPGLDHWMSWLPLAYVFTVIAVAGVTNAINILDGFNGLASGTSIVSLIFLALLSHETQDPYLRDVSLVMVSVLIGFMALNYPWGKIFLGDAGAYFIGFIIAWIALLLPMRNPEVSPWASLLVCIYPVTEVLYSMVRRSFNRVSSGKPDNLHLHSLIKTRLIRRYVGHFPSWARNSLVAPTIWFITCMAGFFALLFETNAVALMFCCTVFLIIYHLSYRFLLRLPEVILLGESDDKNGY